MFNHVFEHMGSLVCYYNVDLYCVVDRFSEVDLYSVETT